jgi:hypothetical protein
VKWLQVKALSSVPQNKKNIKKKKKGQALVTYTCNPGYSGGSQENCGLKPAQAIVLKTLS